MRLEEKAATMRQMLDGICVKTMVLINPNRLPRCAATGSENAERTTRVKTAKHFMRTPLVKDSIVLPITRADLDCNPDEVAGVVDSFISSAGDVKGWNGIETFF